MSTVELTDEGDIKLEAGEPDDITTQLGKYGTGKFEPYKISTRYDGVNIFYVYIIKSEYLPSKFNSTDDFVETLRIQSATNEYVQNYAELGGDYLNEYLKKTGLIDENTYFVKVPSELDDLTDEFFNSFIGMSNNIVKDGVILNEEFSVENLSISETAPQEAKDYFEDVFGNLNKVDAYYSFDELNIDRKFFKYLNGFVKVDWSKFDDIPPNSEIILIRDKLKYGHIIYDCIEKLNSNFNVIGVVNLFRQF